MRTGTRNSLLVFTSSILYPDRASITDYFTTLCTSQSHGLPAEITIEWVSALTIYHNSSDQQVLNPPWHLAYFYSILAGSCGCSDNSQDTTCFLSKNAVAALDRSTVSSVNMTDNLSTPAVTPTDTAVGVTDAMALIEAGSATYLAMYHHCLHGSTHWDIGHGPVEM